MIENNKEPDQAEIIWAIHHQLLLLTAVYFIIVSVILHGFYRLSVVYSYKFGDLSFVYPIARGSSSLLIAFVSLIFLQDYISLLGFIGILTVCIGIFLISYSRDYQFNFTSFILAISTALLITSYTLVDGYGIRLSQNKFSYLFWMLLYNQRPLFLLYHYQSTNHQLIQIFPNLYFYLNI